MVVFVFVAIAYGIGVGGIKLSCFIQLMFFFLLYCTVYLEGYVSEISERLSEEMGLGDAGCRCTSSRWDENEVEKWKVRFLFFPPKKEAPR